MDDKRFDDDYADTLPTFDDDKKPEIEEKPAKAPAITMHKMLEEREDDKPDKDKGEEKSSIERKTVYDDLTQKEHLFSKAKLEVDSDFEKEMAKKKELEEEKRQEVIERERRAKKARLLRELKEEQKAGITDYEKLALIAELESESTKSKIEGKTNDLANQLNQAISHNIHTNNDVTPSETEKAIHSGTMGAIAVEIVLFFIFVPNQIFIFPNYLRFTLAAVSIILALISVIVLIVTGNMAEKRHVPKKLHKLYFAASIVPGAILRVVFGTLLAKLFEFIPVAGNYIGYSIGVALGATMHYGFLRLYYIGLNYAASIINSATAIIAFILPNVISGTINQPMDQKSQFGYYIYLIEAVFVIIVDEIIFMLFQRKQSK